MVSLQPWTTLLCVLLGNCGFWLFCFNRVNATGMPRRQTKRIEKLFILLCFAIPALVGVVEWPSLRPWLFYSHDWWPTGPAGGGTSLYSLWAIFSLVSLLLLGPLWLESRRWIIPPQHLRHCRVEQFDVSQATGGQATGDRLTYWLDKLPGNQITQLEVSRKELQLTRAIHGIDGLKIGHLSDLHFTGQLSPRHYEFVFECFQALHPDLIVITGDIIDTASCLPWLEPLLGRLQAPLGCTYLLGNHDRRLSDLTPLTTSLAALGYHDLGVADQSLQLESGAQIWLTGNEQPWLERHVPPRSSATVEADGPIALADIACAGQANKEEDEGQVSSLLRLGLSHSPDQIAWARQQGLDLLLAGHTHGGQVRLPMIGPIVAPSRYGSRFASGVFHLPPTLMHVSRGVAGTHPLRWRCRPEVSLLTLRTAPLGDKQGAYRGDRSVSEVRQRASASS
ncbi:MAG: metallophosphoesterase [Planctomycetales bacterium]|nr:metallophosphoesterase [Planctomycetales bacterium]